MEIVNTPPPNYAEITAHFNLESVRAVFTYGNTLYNPSDAEIPDNLLKHEEVHAKQQGYSEAGAQAWWERYFSDDG